MIKATFPFFFLLHLTKISFLKSVPNMYSPQFFLNYANHYVLRKILTLSKHQDQAYPTMAVHREPSEVGSKVTEGNTVLIV